MTPELFSDLAYDLAMGSGPDADDLVSACDDLVAQARAEEHAKVERLRLVWKSARRGRRSARRLNAELVRSMDMLRAELAETTHALEVTGEKLTAVRGQRDRAETDRDTARAAQERLADDMERLITEVTDERRRRADYVRQIETERDAARAELEEIRQRDETTGGVLYDVIRSTLAGALDEHEAVRAIERRLIHPLVAQRQEARAKARRGRRPDAAVSQAVAQRDAVALAAEKEWERHGEDIAAYEKTIAETVAERNDARAEVERLRAEVKRLRAALGTEVRRNSGGRTAPSGAPDSVVRSWAREHDIPTRPKGRVAPDVRAAYEAAWRAEQDAAAPGGTEPGQ